MPRHDPTPGRRSVYGFALASDFPFAHRLGPGSAAPEVAFRCSPRAPLAVRWEQLSPVFAVSRSSDGGDDSAALYRLEGCEVLRFGRVADFYLWPDRIECHLLDPASEDLVEILLLGTVFSYWLERRGIAVLHASAAVIGDRAVGFLSGHRGGKTSLAAALMRAGYPLLTDDVLPVEQQHDTFVGRPGYPQMRMWSDEASHFLGHDDELGIVHPSYPKRRIPVGAGGLGSFCGRSRPLACLYLPRRCRSEGSRQVEIMPVSLREAVIELVRFSFIPTLVAAAGLQPGRLDLFSRLVQEVPIRRILYPSGFDHLPAVCARIVEDLRCDTGCLELSQVAPPEQGVAPPRHDS